MAKRTPKKRRPPQGSRRRSAQQRAALAEADEAEAERSRAERRPRRARPRRRFRPVAWLLRWLLRLGVLAAALLLLVLSLFAYVNPPSTPYMLAESTRLGGVDQVWVPMERIAPVMARAAVAAEDANFCLHWGLDLAAIEAAMDGGAARGGSTISQQVVKNLLLWQGRSWARKVLEAAITPAMEMIWSKRRILEVYLNIAEFGTGIFGIEAAAQHYFGRPAANLTAAQAAALAVILPSPKTRDPRSLPSTLTRHARQVASGAATILADGRAGCFEPG